MSEIDSQPFPNVALIAAGALILLSVAATGAVRYARLHAPAPAVSQAAPATAVDLSFADGADGSVVVRESATGRLLMALPPGGDGFVRGVMRGLAHDRMRRGIGATQPFRLAEWEKGRLTLRDEATGRVIDLDAFGPDNRQAFARFLPRGAAAS